MPELVKIILQFLRENLGVSSIILLMIHGILWDLIKFLFRKIIITSTSQIAKFNKSLINYNVKTFTEINEMYADDIKIVENLKAKNGDELWKMIESVFHHFILLIMIGVMLLAFNSIENDLFFFALLGSTFFTLVRITNTMRQQFELFKGAQNFKKYKIKTENKIQKYEKIIEYFKKFQENKY